MDGFLGRVRVRLFNENIGHPRRIRLITPVIFLLFFLVGSGPTSGLAESPLEKLAPPEQTAIKFGSESPVLDVQSGHSHDITALDFSSDNQILASAGKDGRVKIWDVKSGRLIRTLSVSNYWVYSIAFSPNDKILATGSGDHITRLWDVATGRIVRSLEGHIHPVTSVAFSPDGSKLATGSKANYKYPETALIVVWDVRSGESFGGKILYINGNKSHADGEVRHLTFLDNEKLISVSSKIVLWDVHRGELLKELGEPPTEKVFSFAVSPKRDSLIASVWEIKEKVGNRTTFGPAIRIWELPSGRSKQIHPSRNKGYIILGYFNNSVVMAINENKICEILDLELLDRDPGEYVFQIEGKFDITGIFAVSSDNRLIATALKDKSIKFYGIDSDDSLSGKRIATGQSTAVRDIKISPDGRWLGIALGNGSAKLWNLDLGQFVQSYTGHNTSVHSVDFDRKNKMFITSSYDSRILLFDMYTGGITDKITLRDDISGPNQDLYSLRDFNKELPTHEKYFVPTLLAPRSFTIVTTGEVPLKGSLKNSALAIASSPVKQSLFYGGDSYYISEYDLDTRENKDIYKDKEYGYYAVTKLSFSPDGNFLGVGDENGRILLVDMSNNATTPIYKPPISQKRSPISAISFSSENHHLLAVGDSTETITIINLLTNNPIQALKGHVSPVLSLCFWPSGTQLASGSASGKIKIWDASNARLITTLDGHTSAVNALALASEGKVLVSASDDGSINFWDTEKYERLATVINLDEKNWLTLDSDGFFDGTRLAWQLAPFRFPSEPTKYYEVEQFFSQFFQPGLLNEVLRKRKSMRKILVEAKDPRASLDISRNRRSKLPEVQIVSPEGGTVHPNREVMIEVMLEDTGSGLRDLRVFRNQTLVHFEHGELTPDPRTRKYPLTVKVKLVAGENEIRAYAFNKDNIKSKDATITITGAENLRRKSTAYVLAVGINQYSNTDYNLNFAVNDAMSIAGTLQKRFIKLDTYAHVVPVTLPNKEATKANLLTAFNILSGAIPSPPPDAPDDFRKLRPAEPEDDIIIYFSGHGMADQDRYYLIPHDMGYQGRRADVDNVSRKIIMEHSLSDMDLSKVFEKIDASRMMLILDACQSGQALESEERRRGPMNSRGLAQLAYEKGIYILAAAQSYQAAREFSTLGHGLLTYTLIEEGLKQFAADSNPKDNEITAEEWLDYATQHAGRGVDAAKEQYSKKKGGEEIDGGEATVTGQSPRAYYRRERVGNAWVIGR